MGYGDVGAFFQNARAAAHNRAKPSEYTPQLDKLAAEGVQMRQHYCPAPVCAPSRASLMLGVTQGHANVRDNQFDKALANNHTLASVLRQAGYATVAVGKWGLQGAGRNPTEWPAYPTKRGFDYFFGYARHKDGHEHYPKEGLYDGPKEVWDGAGGHLGPIGQVLHGRFMDGVDQTMDRGPSAHQLGAAFLHLSRL